MALNVLSGKNFGKSQADVATVVGTPFYEGAVKQVWIYSEPVSGPDPPAIVAIVFKHNSTCVAKATRLFL